VERGDMEGLKALTQLLDRVAREEARRQGLTGIASTGGVRAAEASALSS